MAAGGSLGNRQKGAGAGSACLNCCQDRGACTLLWEGKCCSNLFIISVQKEETRLNNFP